MIVALLIVHGLLAVALLGAITHQALERGPEAGGRRVAVLRGRFRSVDSSAYATAIVVLFVVTAIGGGAPVSAVPARRSHGPRGPAAARRQRRVRNQGASGRDRARAAADLLALLEAPLVPEQAAARRYLTWLLAFIVWWSFLVGHVLNNIKGLLP